MYAGQQWQQWQSRRVNILRSFSSSSHWPFINIHLLRSIAPNLSKSWHILSRASDIGQQQVKGEALQWCHKSDTSWSPSPSLTTSCSLSLPVCLPVLLNSSLTGTICPPDFDLLRLIFSTSVPGLELLYPTTDHNSITSLRPFGVRIRIKSFYFSCAAMAL